jgi:hypothetical protein
VHKPSAERRRRATWVHYLPSTGIQVRKPKRLNTCSYKFTTLFLCKVVFSVVELTRKQG